ncbi:hypothetical protein SLA2020_520910 [Shorea laevis]
MKQGKGETLNPGNSKSLTNIFKQRKLSSQEAKIQNVEEEKEDAGDGKGFFACYLLTSLSPRHKGHTYIGFTVNPHRRIRQHNGEIGSGAWRTKSRRPWEMVLCIYGFPTNVSALQFEWAWQHPKESVAVRQAAASFKSFSGVANKIKLAYIMLTLPEWHSLNIAVNYFSTQYTNHSAGCPSLPKQMKVEICSMDKLPCYTKREECLPDWDDLEKCDEASNVGETVEETCAYAAASTVSARYLHSCSEASCEQPGQFREYESGNSEDTSNIGIDHKEPFIFIDSPVRTASSILNTISMDETVESTDISTGEIQSPGIKQFTNAIAADEVEPPWSRGGKLLTTEVAGDKDQLHSSGLAHEIEVIDLLTPSPYGRSRTHGKKRRVSSFARDIIDLT